MKYPIRALGWATIVLLVLVILFSGTLVYSAMQVGIELGETQVTASNGTIITSVPFTINNKGFYDLSNLEIATYITDENGTSISNSTTSSSISKGSKDTIPHNISISLNEITAKNLTYMLTNDTVLNMDILVALTYAHAIPLKISLNTTMDWGAPLYNLTVGGISPVPPNQVDVSLSFKNNAFFSLNGTIRLEIWDSSENKIGSGTGPISVLPGDSYDDAITVTITGDPSEVAEVHLHFDTSLFSYGPVVMAVD